MAIAVSIFMTGCAAQRKSVPDMENSSETGEAAQTTSEMTTNEDPETSEPPVSLEVPAETTDASEMNTPEPEPPPFDIQHWIAYAKSYAQSIGLCLDPSAVYCWDNPIRANEKSLYLERDIQSRLNMYVNMGDITDVWIWAEETADNSYALYIGYA